MDEHSECPKLKKIKKIFMQIVAVLNIYEKHELYLSACLYLHFDVHGNLIFNFRKHPWKSSQQKRETRSFCITRQYRLTFCIDGLLQGDENKFSEVKRANLLLDSWLKWVCGFCVEPICPHKSNLGQVLCESLLIKTSETETKRHCRTQYF